MRARGVIITPVAAALAALLLASGGGCGCGGDAATAERAPHPVVDAAEEAIRIGTGIKKQHIDDLAQRQLAFNAGWQASYAHAWLTTLREARENGPGAFRREVLGAWPKWILFALLIGALMRVLLSMRPPHWSRLARDGEEKVGWLRQAGMLGLKFLAWLRAPLTVVAGPAVESQDDLVKAVQHARDAERQLKASGEAARTLAAAAEQTGAALADRIGAWQTDVAQTRAYLEEEGAGASKKQAQRYLTALDEARRAAEKLRVDLTRAVAMEAAVPEGTWQGFLRAVEERPELPQAKTREGKTVAPWVRLAGWIGLGALGTAVFAMAAWAAAGALPFFIAFLLAFTGIVGTAGVRAMLAARSDSSLLPGLADRLITRLITFVGIVAAVMVLSTMASQESGLDLGDPPLVEVPREAKDIDVPAPPVGVLLAPDSN